MRSYTLWLAVLTLTVAVSGRAAATPLYPWNDHASPFDFLFGNEIDAHQQTTETRGGSLTGFFYVSFTGVVTKDGYRVMTHADCNGESACTVGWLLRGRPAHGTLLSQDHGEHPLFAVARSEIPQPGAYVHFHWLDSMPVLGESVGGYLLEMTAVDRFCFMHEGADSAQSTLTCRQNDGVPVTPGVDIATHLNIVATP